MSRRHHPAAAGQPTYAERLGQIHGLLDTCTQDRLARVARTARKLYGVQSAVLVLWRGTRLAQQVQDGGPELPMGTLLALGQDVQRGGAPRSMDTPAGPVRVIALAPLSWDRGLSGGCLCLVDARPRAFGPEDLQSLDDLATWAEHELDVVRLGQALALRMA